MKATTSNSARDKTYVRCGVCFNSAMATKTIIQLVDDIDGTDIADGKGETVSFALDGTAYSIDLTKKNADKFRGLFQDYIAAGSKVGKAPKGRSKATSTGPDPKDVRGWARDNGIDVPDRGRIPATVLDAYNSAN